MSGHGSSAPRAEPSLAQFGAPQTQTWRRSTLDAHALRIDVGDKETLPIDRLHVAAHVDGFRARVELTVDFDNPHARALEGTFQLRLPEGASPQRLAFGGHEWVPREMEAPPHITTTAILEQLRGDPVVLVREAHVVERDLAAVAFRSTVQRGVDPALAEWTGTGIFNARLFPIFPQMKHRVVVGYDLDLAEVGDAWHLQLGLPEGARERLLDVSVATPAGQSVALAGATGTRGKDGRTHFRVEDPSRVLFELTLRGADAFALRGLDHANMPWVAARVRPSIPVAPSDGARRAIFAVDVSLSSNPDRFEVCLELLQEILAANREEIREFAVLFYDVEAFWWQPRFVPNTSVDVAKLRIFADTLALEGATDLGVAIDEAVDPQWLPAGAAKDWDLFLLGDGGSTWGEPSTARIAARARQLKGRLFAYRTGLPGGELNVLARLARETGGAVFSVGGAAEVRAASTAHRAQPWELLAVEIDGVQDIVVDGAPRFVYPGQMLTLAGRGSEAAQVRLTVRRGAETRKVVAALPTPIDTELAPRVYGQIAVAQLEELADARGVHALEYARHFRVAGRTASLLMLEDFDYRRYGITPGIAKVDASVVALWHATTQVADARAREERVLGDPKREFDAWRKHLRKSRYGAMSADVARFLDQLPRSAFTIEVPRLQCARHDRDAVAADLLAALSTQQLEYDAVLADARRRRRDLGAADGLKALSSLVEVMPGDGPIARDVALVAAEWGLGAQVTGLLRRTAIARPDEPQSYAALAQNLADIGAYDLAAAYFEIAMHAEWETAGLDYRPIIRLDYLSMLRRVPARKFSDPAFVTARARELVSETGIGVQDLVIAIAWTSDNADVDLHVIEPDGTEVFYGTTDRRGRSRLSGDMQVGYGPEIYTARRPAKGTYRVFVHYYRSDPNRLSARTRVRATVFRNFGSGNETVQHTSISLRDGAEVHEVGVIKI